MGTKDYGGHVVTLRPAELSDEARLLEWRNDPATRAASFSKNQVSADDHHRWLLRKLQDPDCALFIVLIDSEPAGQVRLDRIEPGLAEVSIGLAPEARGWGVGREALRLATESASELLGVGTVSALVKPVNVASLRSFDAAGFSEFRRDEHVVELRRPTGD
jgi:RimJ/RimL family protein N-acetyltransferase